MRIIDRFKGAGWWAGLASAIVTIATSWGLIVSALAGLVAWLGKGAFNALNDTYIQRGANVSLWLLWAYIALSFLYRLRNGIKTIPHVDYAFGIIIEGISLNQDTTKDGNIQPHLQFRNVVNAAIKVHIKDVRVIINGRTHPDSPVVTMVVPRLGQKGIGAGLFKKVDLMGKGKVEGILDVTIEYGPHDGAAVRKLRLKIKLFIQPPTVNTGQWGLGNEYISEEDTQI